MDLGFLMALDILRTHWSQPLHITSGYRCAKHNADPKVGGEPKSMHLTGRAVDIKMPDANERYAFVRLAMKLGFYGIGIMATAVHLDNRTGKRVLFHYYGKEKPK